MGGITTGAGTTISGTTGAATIGTGAGTTTSGIVGAAATCSQKNGY